MNEQKNFINRSEEQNRDFTVFLMKGSCSDDKERRYMHWKRSVKKAMVHSKYLAILIAIVMASALVGTGPGFGFGARSVGMGLAFIALSDDADAVFFNPAGLAQFKAGDREVSVMLKGNDRTIESFDTLAVTGQVMREEKRLKFSIQEYLRQDFRPKLHEEKLYFNYGIGAQFLKVDDLQDYFEQTNLVFAGAREIESVPRLSIGAKVLYSTNKTKTLNGDMTTFGLGALYEFNDKINIGLVFEDLFSSGPFAAPTLINLGLLLKITENTRLAIDGYNLTSEDVSWRWRNDAGAEFRVGMEKTFVNDTLAIRFGTMNGNLNLGFGIQITPTFRIDYGFNNDNKTGIQTNPLEQQHFISADIKF